jgi:hypothetical protein
MNNGYLLYQAERTPSRAEQRAADARRGELARSLSQLLHPRRDTAASTADCPCPADYPCPAPGTAVAVPDYPPAEWAGALK